MGESLRIDSVRFLSLNFGDKEDTGSTNGTYLNGEPIQPNVDVRLKNKDVILLGSTRITWVC